MLDLDAIANQRAGALRQDGGAWREADMIFEIGEALRVGYRGYVACRPEARAARRS